MAEGATVLGGNMVLWSDLQNRIFDKASVMDRSLVIVARAGTGKTTTILEAASRLPRGRVLFAAFGAAIAAELAGRVPQGVEAKTLHSVGFGSVRARFPKIKMVEGKGKAIARSICERERLDGAEGPIARMAGLAKSVMLTDASELGDLSLDLGIVETERGAALLAPLALEACDTAARDTNTMDFDDMVFLPWRLEMYRATYDFVIVDEAQDMSPSQLWIAKSVLRKGGKMIIVGDDRQAIYGWRGADSQALERMTRELGADVLPLSITYRCPRKVVEMAQAIVPDYQAAPEAPEGNIGPGNAMDALPGDFILSRKNAPLMALCLALLAKGVPATITGRDVGKALRSLVERSEATDIPALVKWIEEWRRAELLKLSGIGDQDKAERKAQEVDDKAECLIALTDGCTTIHCIFSRLETLFSDADPRSMVVLSSVHKAKGLERDRVFVLTDTFRNTSEEERNLWYVAITRTKRDLFLVKAPKN